MLIAGLLWLIFKKSQSFLRKIYNNLSNINLKLIVAIKLHSFAFFQNYFVERC